MFTKNQTGGHSREGKKSLTRSGRKKKSVTCKKGRNREKDLLKGKSRYGGKELEGRGGRGAARA